MTNEVEQREYLYVENSFGGDVSVVDIAARGGGRVHRDRPSPGRRDLLECRRYALHERAEGPYRSAQRRARVASRGRSSPSTRQPRDRLAATGDRHAAPPDHLAGRPLPVPTDLQQGLHRSHRHAGARDRAKVPVGYGSHGTRLSPDGKRVYVGCMFSDQITVFDSRDLQVLRRSPSRRRYALLADPR